MNIIMSRALPQHHPIRGLLPANQQEQLYQQPDQQKQRHKHQKSSMSSVLASTPTSPQSPLDFTDRIPFTEIKLSNETLGSGSFGTVFKGRWRGRTVAVKQFKTREEIESFLVEVKQLSCVKHPNIVTLYGASTLTSTAYLIMEYAEGGSLNHLLHESKHQAYDLRHACSWARQAARGVAYLHSIRPKPIMHRDLKPANLLLFERGMILKICDFGTACDVKTQMTSNTGSPSYMAPEVFASSSYLESGDVFSWGIIFWEILTRTHPYNQSFSNPFQILWSVNQGTRPDEIEDCPKPIWHLITRCWNKDPKTRPSMNWIAQEMDTIFSLTAKRIQSDKNAIDSRHQQQPQQQNRYKSILNRLTNTATSPSSSSPQPHTSSQLPRPSLPAIDSPIETSSRSPLDGHMITSDQLVYMRQHDVSRIASTSSSSQHHYQNDIFNEHHHQQYHHQISGYQEQSISSQVLAANRKRALQHYINILRDTHKKLADENKCDKKTTADVLAEYQRLKDEVHSKRRHVETVAQQAHSKQSSTAQTPTSPEQQTEEAPLSQHQRMDTDVAINKMNSKLLIVLLLCAICAGPVTCISRWFTATYNDLRFTMYRYGYCVNGLLPLNTTRVNETEYLVKQIRYFLDQGNYDNEQLANVSALMDNFCRQNVDLSYPISVHIDIYKFSNNHTRGKETRCKAIDQAMDSMYYVFKKAASNRSEPLDFSTIVYYPNASDPTASYNLSDLINTSWISSETVLEQVCTITNATKEYVQARASNSTAQQRQQLPQGYVSAFLEYIDSWMEPLLGLQKRLYWEGTTRFEMMTTLVGSGLSTVRRGIVNGLDSTGRMIFNRQRGNSSSLVNSTINSANQTDPRNRTKGTPSPIFLGRNVTSSPALDVSVSTTGTTTPSGFNRSTTAAPSPRAN